MTSSWTLHLQRSPCIWKASWWLPPHQKCCPSTSPYLSLQHFKGNPLKLSPNLNPRASFCATYKSLSVCISHTQESLPQTLRRKRDIHTRSRVLPAEKESAFNGTDNMLFPPENVGCTLSLRSIDLECVISLTWSITAFRSAAKTDLLTEPTRSHRYMVWITEQQLLSWATSWILQLAV